MRWARGLLERVVRARRLTADPRTSRKSNPSSLFRHTSGRTFDSPVPIIPPLPAPTRRFDRVPTPRAAMIVPCASSSWSGDFRGTRSTRR